MKQNTKVKVSIIIAAVLFGTMEVALKIGGNGFDPFQLTFLRFLIGGILLIPFAIYETKTITSSLSIKDFVYVSMLGFVCIPLSMLVFQIGVMHCNASTASVIISTNPLFTMIFAYIILKEDITKNKIRAMAIGILGLILMIKPWDIASGDTFFGVSMLIIAAVTFGLYTVLGKKSIGKVGLFRQTSISFISGSIILLIIILLLGKPVVSNIGDNIILLLYVGFAITGLGYVAFFTAIKNSNASTASVVFFIKIGIAPLFAIIILKESVSWNTVMGIALVLLASNINFRELKKNDKKN